LLASCSPDKTAYTARWRNAVDGGRKVKGFIDLHCHCLPGIDDGARDASAGRAILDGLVALGFETVCATPHQKMGAYLPDAARISAAEAALRSSGRELPVSLMVGAENFWDDVLLQRIGTQEIPRYGDSRAFLFELPVQMVPIGLEEVLFQIRLKGMVPVLAHPERYLSLQRDTRRLDRLGNIAAFVVDLGALDGAHGREQKKFARALVEEGRATALASDTHSTDELRAVAAGIQWVRKRLGDARATELLRDNPRQLLDGDLPTCR
jgi:protein-tyrosine phosphatase